MYTIFNKLGEILIFKSNDILDDLVHCNSAAKKVFQKKFSKSGNIILTFRFATFSFQDALIMNLSEFKPIWSVSILSV